MFMFIYVEYSTVYSIDDMRTVLGLDSFEFQVLYVLYAIESPIVKLAYFNALIA